MNNPFQQIDKSQFPSIKRGEKIQNTPSACCLPKTGDGELDDQALFLRAMSNVAKHQDKKTHVSKTQDFTLNQQIRIPQKVSTKEVKNKKQTSVLHIQECENGFAPAALRDEFLDAMREVVPLGGNGRAVNPVPDRKNAPQIAQDLMESFMEGKLEFALSNTKEYCEGYVVGLDEMTMNKLRSGALSPEAHLDLHGLNTVQAFEAMRNFMRGSWYKSLRTVLIIPGRGQNSPNGIGILRNKVQDWLTQDPFKRVVLAFCTAQQLDGGLGSIYVLLRKYKKKGRVYWERTPNDADLNELI